MPTEVMDQVGTSEPYDAVKGAMMQLIASLYDRMRESQGEFASAALRWAQAQDKPSREKASTAVGDAIQKYAESLHLIINCLPSGPVTTEMRISRWPLPTLSMDAEIQAAARGARLAERMAKSVGRSERGGEPATAVESGQK